MSEYVWKKQEAEAVQGDHPENIRRVLLLYTGGTIGMKWTKESGKLGILTPYCQNVILEPWPTYRRKLIYYSTPTTHPRHTPLPKSAYAYYTTAYPANING